MFVVGEFQPSVRIPCIPVKVSQHDTSMILLHKLLLHALSMLQHNVSGNVFVLGKVCMGLEETFPTVPKSEPYCTIQ